MTGHPRYVLLHHATLMYDICRYICGTIYMCDISALLLSCTVLSCPALSAGLSAIWRRRTPSWAAATTAARRSGTLWETQKQVSECQRRTGHRRAGQEGRARTYHITYSLLYTRQCAASLPPHPSFLLSSPSLRSLALQGMS